MPHELLHGSLLLEVLQVKPTREEFEQAYSVIMSYIDTEPNSRKLFHALLSFALQMRDGE
jgi:hypothetical protein